jgi:hypothetical protein
MCDRGCKHEDEHGECMRDYPPANCPKRRDDPAADAADDTDDDSDEYTKRMEKYGTEGLP